jgi:hypothetical protein
MRAGRLRKAVFFTTFEENRRSGFNFGFGIGAAMMQQLRLRRAIKVNKAVIIITRLSFGSRRAKEKVKT